MKTICIFVMLIIQLLNPKDINVPKTGVFTPKELDNKPSVVGTPYLCIMNHHLNFSLENIVEEIDGTLVTEEWRDIAGYEDVYQISSFGRVKALFRITDRPHRCGRLVKYPLKEKIKASWVNQDTGYVQNQLTTEKGQKSLHLVHRLVAQTFIPNPENKIDVNHKKGIKTDNRVSKLEWNTRSENQKHSFRIGLAKPNSGCFKKGIASTKKKPVIRTDSEGRETVFSSGTEAAREMGVYHSSIVNCLKGKSKTSHKYFWRYA